MCILYFCHIYKKEITNILRKTNSDIRYKMDLSIVAIITTVLNYFIYFQSIVYIPKLEEIPFMVFSSILFVIYGLVVRVVMREPTITMMFNPIMQIVGLSIIATLIWMSVFNLYILAFSILLYFACLFVCDIYMFRSLILQQFYEQRMRQEDSLDEYEFDDEDDEDEFP